MNIKKNLFRVTIILGVMSSVLYAASPSFNCKYAKTYVEKRICVEKKLAELDNSLSYTYQQIYSKISAKDAIDLKDDQEKWVHKRDKSCDMKNDECIKKHYQKRIAFLSKVLKKISTKSSDSEKYKVYKFGDKYLKGKISYEVLDDKVKLNVHAKNLYKKGKGGVSISFPQLKNDERIILKDGYGFSTLKTYTSGSKLWSGKYKRSIYSDYLMIEGWIDKWEDKGYRKEALLRIDTKDMDSLVVNVRTVWVKGKREVAIPEYGEKDQQGYHVKQLVIKLPDTKTVKTNKTHSSVPKTSNNNEKINPLTKNEANKILRRGHKEFQKRCSRCHKSSFSLSKKSSEWIKLFKNYPETYTNAHKGVAKKDKLVSNLSKSSMDEARKEKILSRLYKFPSENLQAYLTNFASDTGNISHYGYGEGTSLEKANITLELVNIYMTKTKTRKHFIIGAHKYHMATMGCFEKKDAFDAAMAINIGSNAAKEYLKKATSSNYTKGCIPLVKSQKPKLEIIKKLESPVKTGSKYTMYSVKLLEMDGKDYRKFNMKFYIVDLRNNYWASVPKK